MPIFTTYYAGLAAGTLDDAEAIAITDAGGLFAATNVEDALAEVATDVANQPPETAILFTGAANNYWSTPSSAALNTSGDLELVWRASLDDYTPAAFHAIVAKRSNADGLAWQLVHSSTSGNLAFSLQTGSTNYFNNAFVVNPGWVDGTTYWFRFRRASGSGVVTADYAADQPTEPTSWTSLTVTGTQTAGVIDSNVAPLEVACERAGATPWMGTICRVIMRTTFGGANIADFSAAVPVFPRYSDPAGNVWTPAGSAWSWAIKS